MTIEDYNKLVNAQKVLEAIRCKAKELTTGENLASILKKDLGTYPDTILFDLFRFVEGLGRSSD